MKKRKIVSLIMIIVGMIIFITPMILKKITKENNKGNLYYYTENMSNKSDEELEYLKDMRKKYNENLIQTDYDTISGECEGIIGYIEIPSIDLYYPVYFGSSEDILEKGIGHICSTSLPDGEKGTRTVLVGHNGIYGKDFFTKINELSEGDTVIFYIFDEKYEYTVGDSEVYSPDNLQFNVKSGENILTLVTCTPYGSNEKRLVVNCYVKK